MPIVKFLKHCPPHMPGETAGMDDTHARALEAKGVVTILPQSTPPARRRAAGNETGASTAPLLSDGSTPPMEQAQPEGASPAGGANG